MTADESDARLIRSVTLCGDAFPLPAGATARVGAPRLYAEAAVRRGVRYTLDGESLVVIGRSSLRVFDGRTFLPTRVLSCTTKIVGAHFLDDQDAVVLLCGEFDGRLVVWDFSNRTLRELDPGIPHAKVFCVLADGARVASGGRGDVEVRQFPEGTVLSQFAMPAAGDSPTGGDVSSVALSDDGQLVAASMEVVNYIGQFDRDPPDTLVRVWNVDSGEEVAAHTVEARWCPGLRFDDDGDSLEIGRYNDRRVLRISTGQVHERTEPRRASATGPAFGLPAAVPPVEAVAASRDGAWLASPHRLWSTATGAVTLLPANEDIGSRALIFSGDGKTLYRARQKGGVDSLALPSGELRSTLVLPLDYGNHIFLPDGERIIVADKETGEDTGLRIIRLADGVEVGRMSCPGRYLSRFAVSEDGRWLAARNGNDLICVWNLDERALKNTIEPGRNGRSRSPSLVALSSDGSVLATTQMLSSRITLRARDTGKVRGRILLPEDLLIRALCFTRDPDTLIATGGFSVFVVSLHQAPRRIGDHLDRIPALAIAADGQRLHTGSEDGTVTTWPMP